MSVGNVTRFLVSTMLAISAAPSASAATMLIEASGVWDDVTPPTALTAANTQFRFSFRIDQSVPFNPTTAFADFRYALGGQTVSATATEVTFFPQNAGGGLQIRFAPDLLLAGLGPDLLLGGQLGTFTTPLAMTFVTNTGYATGKMTISAVNGNAVPEPVEWVLLISGIGIAGVALRTRQRAAASASGMARFVRTGSRI